MPIFNHKIKLQLIMTLSIIILVGLLSIKSASAYSYAAAGKEPLIEASEAFYKAFNDKSLTLISIYRLYTNKKCRYLIS